MLNIYVAENCFTGKYNFNYCLWEYDLEIFAFKIKNFGSAFEEFLFCCYLRNIQHLILTLSIFRNIISVIINNKPVIIIRFIREVCDWIKNLIFN